MSIDSYYEFVDMLERGLLSPTLFRSPTPPKFGWLISPILAGLLAILQAQLAGN
jgi:hypothetical protein